MGASIPFRVRGVILVDTELFASNQKEIEDSIKNLFENSFVSADSCNLENLSIVDEHDYNQEM